MPDFVFEEKIVFFVGFVRTACKVQRNLVGNYYLVDLSFFSCFFVCLYHNVVGFGWSSHHLQNSVTEFLWIVCLLSFGFVEKVVNFTTVCCSSLLFIKENWLGSWLWYLLNISFFVWLILRNCTVRFYYRSTYIIIC